MNDRNSMLFNYNWFNNKHLRLRNTQHLTAALICELYCYDYLIEFSFLRFLIENELCPIFLL